MMDHPNEPRFPKLSAADKRRVLRALKATMPDLKLEKPQVQSTVRSSSIRSSVKARKIFN